MFVPNKASAFGYIIGLDPILLLWVFFFEGLYKCESGCQRVRDTQPHARLLYDDVGDDALRLYLIFPAILSVQCYGD